MAESFFDETVASPQIGSWEKLVRLANCESNMARDPGKVHPDIMIAPPTEEQEAQLLQDRQGEQDAEDQEGEEGLDIPQKLRSMPQFRWRNKNRKSPRFPGGCAEKEDFDNPFDDLHPEILVEILRMVLVFDGDSIHAISRLDPFVQPTSLPTNCDGIVALLHRFHIGSGAFNITCATKPQDLLAPLVVSKKWNYIGAHLFYSQNKFCFSSLGEWGRFAVGIRQRLQRIQDIEIFWTGSQDVCFQPNKRGKFTSRRTFPLMWLGEAKWLKTMVVYIQESSPPYMRRKHEPRGVIQYMKDKTKEQPNFRLCRSLRTLQGLDYVHMLRGMEKVDFIDYDRGPAQKMAVRDFTTVMDANNAVRRPKTEQDARQSKLRNLAALVSTYRPDSEVFRAVRAATARCDPNIPQEPPHDVPLGPAPVIIQDSDDQESDENDSSKSSSSDSDLKSDSESDDDDGSDPDDNGDEAIGSSSRGTSTTDRQDRMSIAFDFDSDYRFPSRFNRDTSMPRTIVTCPSDSEEEEAGAGAEATRNGTPTGNDRENPLYIQDDDGDGNERTQSLRDRLGQRGRPLVIVDEDEPDQNGSGPGQEESLFVTGSPEVALQDQFVTKLETPEVPRVGSTLSAGHAISATARSSDSPFRTRVPGEASAPHHQVREESSLFVTSTPYNRIVRSSTADTSREGTRAKTEASEQTTAVVDLTEQQGPRKRSWYESNSAEGSEEEGDTAEHSPKRPRTPR